MVNYTILAGGFTSFIITYLFDPVHNTLTLSQNTTTGQSPSWIALHPTNRSVLYAVNEISPVGNLQSFLVTPEGQLTHGDTASTGGNGPTFTEFLATGEVSGLNFGSPNVSFVPTVPGDPLQFVKEPKVSPFVQFPVPEGAPSNPHMSLQVGHEVLVPDLGANKIWRIQRAETGEFRVLGQIDVDAGAGPRHIAFKDEVLFTIHEKTNALTAQMIPPLDDHPLPLIANVSIVPEDAPTGTKFAAAEILILPESASPHGETLLYASNRNIGDVIDDRGDSIAIFRFVREPSYNRFVKSRRSYHAGADQGKLVLVKQIFTGLQQIRSMAFSPDGKYLIASGNVGDAGVKVFRVDHAGSDLVEVASNTEVPTRTTFVFV